MQGPVRIGVLVGEKSENLQFIIDACRIRYIDGQVVFVGALSPAVEGIKIARINGISSFFVDGRQAITKAESNKYSLPVFDLNKEVQHIVANGPEEVGKINDRVLVDSLLLAEIKKYDYDLLIMDSYTKLVSCFFIDAINVDNNGVHRLLSNHPSLLPAFKGLKAREQAFKSDVCVAGSSIIEVDYTMDSGRIIDQRAFYVERPCTREYFFTMAEKNEKTLYVRALRKYINDNYKKLRRV